VNGIILLEVDKWYRLIFPPLYISPVSNNEGYLLIPNKFFPVWRTQRSDTQITTKLFFNNANYLEPQCTTPNTAFTRLTIPPVTTEYGKAFEFCCAVNRPELTWMYIPSNTTKLSHLYCPFRALWIDLKTLSLQTNTVLPTRVLLLISFWIFRYLLVHKEGKTTDVCYVLYCGKMFWTNSFT
jgi:hypothetical protein